MQHTHTLSCWLYLCNDSQDTNRILAIVLLRIDCTRGAGRREAENTKGINTNLSAVMDEFAKRNLRPARAKNNGTHRVMAQ